MKLLLDTCAILWLAGQEDDLSDEARRLIRANPATLFVSAISGFEIALKQRKGRLDLGMPASFWWTRAIAHHGLRATPITAEIAIASAELPPLHHDPADRLIIATAIAQGMKVLTSDRLIRQYPDVQTAW